MAYLMPGGGTVEASVQKLRCQFLYLINHEMLLRSLATHLSKKTVNRFP
jgi:hypothetical protein